MIARTCEFCGAGFEVRFPSSTKKLCSQTCANRRERPGQQKAVTLPCGACGEMFRAPRSQVRRGRQFCSQRCMGVGKRRENHYAWKGGRRLTQDGYVLLMVDPEHPFLAMGGKRGWVLEHRMVMAEALGRPLERWETVHHMNGIRDDNRLENLQLRVGHHGPGHAYCCGDCGSRNMVPAEV